MGGDGCSVSKFFVDKANISGKIIKIQGEDYNHIKNVLRLRAGDNIIVNNGEEVDYEAKISSITEKHIEAEILSSTTVKCEPNTRITLYQAIPKGEKMEFIIQKSVEIGVFEITPFISERVIVKLDKDNTRKKTERWNKIAEQAAKQSKRGLVPRVNEPIEFKDLALTYLKKHEKAIIFYENEEKCSLRSCLHKKEKIQNIALVVGPEGGFSENEIEILRDYEIVTLGKRILRTETTGLVGSAIILYETGDLD